MFQALATGDFSEAEVLQVWDDPTAETRWIALGVLGRVRGDEAERVSAILHSEFARARETGDQHTQVTCIDALATRFGHEVVREFQTLWESKIQRDVRTKILDAFGDLGVTDHREEALNLYRRGLRQGRGWSGGISMGTLFRYLFKCAELGVGSSTEVKALIRENWSTLSQKGGGHLYEMALPGISDQSVPLTAIPDLTFPADKMGDQ